MRLFFSLVMILLTGSARSQTDNGPFIRLINPYKTSNPVRSSRQFIIGSTCKTCVLTINDKPVSIYPTGAFVQELNLLPGDSAFIIRAEATNRSLSKKINYTYVLPTPAEPVKA